jgi:hypothetical protein
MPSLNKPGALSLNPSPPQNQKSSPEPEQCSRVQDPIGLEIERCFRQSNLLWLATCLDDNFLGLHGIGLHKEARQAVVRGLVNLSHDEVKTVKSAKCEIKVYPEWWRQIPEVRCGDPWVRSDIDWHAWNGWLCFMLQDEWTDCVTRVYGDGEIRDAARYAAQLCLRNVRWLLYRHYIGQVLKMQQWPKEWPARPHDEAGRLEYRRELRKLHAYEP